MWGSFVEYAYSVVIKQKRDHFLRYGIRILSLTKGIRILSLTKGLYFFSSDHKQPNLLLH